MDTEAVLARPNPDASRAEVLDQFRHQVYGAAPVDGWELSWDLLSEHRTDTGLLRRQWALIISTDRGRHCCLVMADLPPGRESVPAFLALNFRGNHAVTADPQVLDPQREADRCGPIHYDGLREGITVPVPIGIEAHRWPAELITGRGYAAITACYLQSGPDSAEVFSHGIHPLFASSTLDTRGPGEWGAISIWAWLLSRILDALEGGMIDGVDAGRVAVIGHSRLGKTALWAAAQDQRFAAAISNDSGCMGAALSRPVGETPEVLARIRPYWFAPRFSRTVLAGEPLPVDQWQLLAAIAPRPVHVGSASDDANADPAGELGSLLAAVPAWGAAAEEAADVALPRADTVRWWRTAPLAYHLRRGGHNLMPWDWIQYLSFADRWL